MIVFKHLRKRRISVKLRELAHGESTDLCKLPAERTEATLTELLRLVASAADAPQQRFVTNPLLWTVEERAMLLTYYLAQVTSDGPDFSVGSARLSNYLDFEADSTMDETELGKVVNKALVMRPLLGVHAQALEGVCSEYNDWVTGAMACQIFQAGEAQPDWANMAEAEVQKWIKAKAEILAGLPSSEFDALYVAWLSGSDRLRHFAAYSFNDDGIVFDAFQKGEGGAEFPPARFLAVSAVSRIARVLSGRPD